MIDYNKQEIRDALTDEQIEELLESWGGEPERTSFGLISRTICHNALTDDPSRKLYYYNNSKLFKCYSGCEDDVFDIFQLYIKVKNIQDHTLIDFNYAIRSIADHFGISGTYVEDDESTKLEDWQYLENYQRIEEINPKETNEILLKEYDKSILNNFNYSVSISPWLRDNIDKNVMSNALIGYYAGGNQITIPHFDQSGRFIGLRGRTLSKEDADLYGKYRPVKVNGQLYNHPLGLNLYGLSWNKPQIKTFQKAIIFESEKSVLQMASYFGWENNLSVAVCGSSISDYQMSLLLAMGVKEVIIGFDKQFKELNTDESKLWHRKLLKLQNKYRTNVLISFLWDKDNLLGYKDSPTDKGKETFLKLFERRIID